MTTDSQIFSLARELPESEREAYLDSACGGDTELKAYLVRLLEADEPDAEVNAERTAPANSVSVGMALEPGIEIGPYRLVSQLGSGGMGVVWSAEQTAPVKREVAIKFVQPELVSQGLVARFNAESQALALMSHPNIAQMFEAGTLPNSQPYFVMEFVDGKPLTEFCDEKNYSIEQRLRLFLDVCAGVQHAHQKGVIHRDLKPTNILVAVEKDIPIPKIIDFGLAKAFDDVQLTEQSQVSIAGMVVGSFQYMSPEQAGGDSKAVDTRSDVYALGAILYELLSGSTPIDKSEVESESGLKVLELIRDRATDRPGKRVQSFEPETLSAIAANRQTSGTQLQRILDGDLGWILLHCLEKQPSKRYASATELAADIQLYLEDHPVRARQRTGIYVARKFYQRNKIATWAGVFVLLGLMVGAAGLADAYVTKANAATEYAELAAKETKARKAADELREKESKAREEAVALGEKERAARIESEEGRRNLRTALKLLQDVYEGLNPELANAGDGQLRAEFVGRLKTSARNIVQANLGGDQDVLVLKIGLAKTLKALGEEASVLPIWRNVVEDVRLLSGADSEDYMSVVANLAAVHLSLGNFDQAHDLFTDARGIALELFGDESDTLIYFDNTLCQVLMKDGKLDAADKASQRLIPRLEKLGLRSSLLWCDAMGVRGQIQARLGKHAEAAVTFRAVLAAYKGQLQPTHRFVLIAKNNLALTQEKLGKPEEAITLMREVVASTQKQFPTGSAPVGKAQINLGAMLANNGKPEEAVALLKDVQESQSGDFEKLLAAVERATIEHKYKLASNALSKIQEIGERAARKLGAKNEVSTRASKYISDFQNKQKK